MMSWFFLPTRPIRRILQSGIDSDLREGGKFLLRGVVGFEVFGFGLLVFVGGAAAAAEVAGGLEGLFHFEWVLHRLWSWWCGVSSGVQGGRLGE